MTPPAVVAVAGASGGSGVEAPADGSGGSIPAGDEGSEVLGAAMSEQRGAYRRASLCVTSSLNARSAPQACADA